MYSLESIAKFNHFDLKELCNFVLNHYKKYEAGTDSGFICVPIEMTEKLVNDFKELGAELCTISITITKRDFEYLLKHRNDNDIIDHIISLTTYHSDEAKKMEDEVE